MKKQLVGFSLVGFFLPFLLAPKPVLPFTFTTSTDSWLISGINLLGLFLSGMMVTGIPLCLMLIGRSDIGADDPGVLVCFTITLLVLVLAITSRFILGLWTDSMIVCAVTSSFLMIVTFCKYCID